LVTQLGYYYISQSNKHNKDDILTRYALELGKPGLISRTKNHNISINLFFY